MATLSAVDLTAGYTPLPAQAKFHAAGDKFRLYSGGFGSGKTLCGVRESIITAFAYPGSTGLISRLRMKDLELTTQLEFWEQLTAMGLNRKPYVQNWSAKVQKLDLANGSSIIFSGLDDEMKLRSMQLSWAYVDEGSEVPASIYRALLGRIRWGNPRRVWITTNPGASGWLRKNFVDENGAKRNYFWINAPTYENKHLPQDYIDSMHEEYPPTWRKKYLEGSWTAFEGQVFTDFDEGVHLIDGDWRPSKEHVVYEGWDFGYRNPTHVTWIAWHPSGREPLIVFGEHEGSLMTVKQHASEVKAMRQELGIDPDQILAFGDPAGAQTTGIEGASYYDEYASLGIYISPSTKEPRIRAVRLSRLFSGNIWNKGTERWPRIVFVRSRTRKTVQSVTSYRFAEDKGTSTEDPKEQFHKEDDHGVDSLGYGVMPISLEGQLEENTPPRAPSGMRIASAEPLTAENADSYPDDDDDEDPYFGSKLYGLG